MQKANILVVLGILCLVSVSTARAQSDLNPNSTPAPPKISGVECPASFEQPACNSFSELTQANDPLINASVMPVHSPKSLAFVCFADFQNTFFVASYRNFTANPKFWLFETIFYTDGVSNTTNGLGVVASSTVSVKGAEDFPPQSPSTFDPLTSVMVPDSELTVTTAFKNISKGTTTKNLTVELHTGRFKIIGTYDDVPAPGKPHDTGVLPEIEGQCVNLTRFRDTQ